MVQKKRCEWFIETFKDRLEKYEVLKIRSFPDGDLGAFEAIEFESDIKCGYINFWSSGYIDFHITDSNTYEDIVACTMLEVSEDDSLEEILSNFVENI